MNSCFAVICKCGHVGRNNYILITFPVIANSKKEAARIARSIPRCKHHHNYAKRRKAFDELMKYIPLKERRYLDD